MNQSIKGRRIGILLFSVLAAALMIFTLPSQMVPAYAKGKTEVYATWKEYQKSGQESGTWNDVAAAMDQAFDKAQELFSAKDYDGAYKWINNAYYGYYETTGFERMAMGYIAGSRKTEVELQFASCKSVAKNKGTEQDFKKELDTLRSMIHHDANVLDGKSDANDSSDAFATSSGAGQASASSGSSTSAATAAFVASFSIILREGFEAILIVGAMIAYLVKMAGEDNARRKKLLLPIYIGSVMGVVMSLVLAWLLNLLRLANSASQEVIEGITALTAVFVLYYVSNWMLSKSETEAWSSYIKSKAEQSSASNNTRALGFTAFLAVFREGAEVVLFFQPMLAGDNIHSVFMGFIIGCISLVFVYLAIHFLSLRIPIKPFFTFTSILMFVMSISFLGGGIKELIEGDVLPMTSPAWLQWIPSNDLMDVLGIYPTLQTLIPQLILLVITVVVYVKQTRKNHALHAQALAEHEAAEAKRIAEEKKAADEQLRKTIREVVEQVLAEKSGQQ